MIGKIHRTLLPTSFLLPFFSTAALTSIPATAQEISVPNSFSAGSPAVAEEVNENFSAVVDAINGAMATTQNTDVVTLLLEDETTPAGGDVVGSATLGRSEEGVRVVIETTMLQPGAAYSVWWLVFNNPEACDPAGCGEADLATPDVEASLFNATGRLADADGNARFSATLPAGFIYTNPASGGVRHLFGPGLQNIESSDIRLIVRCHGTATGTVEQISTFFGDCNTNGPTGCFDAQIAIFTPPDVVAP